MRKLLIGVCAIALVLASTSKEYKYIQNSTQTIYTNPLIEKDIIIQNITLQYLKIKNLFMIK